jgi:hypothetical protein
VKQTVLEASPHYRGLICMACHALFRDKILRMICDNADMQMEFKVQTNVKVSEKMDVNALALTLPQD